MAPLGGVCEAKYLVLLARTTPGHPRLHPRDGFKSWVPGTRPGMTVELRRETQSPSLPLMGRESRSLRARRVGRCTSDRRTRLVWKRIPTPARQSRAGPPHKGEVITTLSPPSKPRLQCNHLVRSRGAFARRRDGGTGYGARGRRGTDGPIALSRSSPDPAPGRRIPASGVPASPTCAVKRRSSGEVMHDAWPVPLVRSRAEGGLISPERFE